MSDTQWIGADDGRNPGTTSVDIIKNLNKQFINQQVKFVVQVGDLVDQTGSTVTSVQNSEDVRVAFAQELYNAGIGFFPLPGNHDSQPLAGAEFVAIYPQTKSGEMGDTPARAFSVPNADSVVQPFPTVTAAPFVVGNTFSTPDPSQTNGQDWRGLSYSFKYNNANFVLLDQFSPLGGNQNYNPYPAAIDLQQSWIDSVLGNKATYEHAFVFGHKGLITENHVDTLFGKDPSMDATGQDAFITSLYKNGVRYYIQGHDHMHDRSLVSVTSGTPTDGTSAKVQNILCASDSSKFYTPGIPSNDVKYDVPTFGHSRQAQISQELHTVGYYVYTVDGPRVTVDYYSAQLSNAAPAGCSGANCEWLISTTPILNFVKAETFGYSLNGKEFQVCQQGQTDCNSSYTQVSDSYKGTTARILSGKNSSTSVDYDSRNLLKTVNTGWTEADGDFRHQCRKGHEVEFNKGASKGDRDGDKNRDRDNTASNILTLWGMADLYGDRTDVYTLSMSYGPEKSSPEHMGKSLFALATEDAKGDWVNAVEMNVGGGTTRFVKGPWKSGYALGTYGVDPAKKTAWAVINYNADFAVASFNQ